MCTNSCLAVTDLRASSAKVEIIKLEKDSVWFVEFRSRNGSCRSTASGFFCDYDDVARRRCVSQGRFDWSAMRPQDRERSGTVRHSSFFEQSM